MKKIIIVFFVLFSINIIAQESFRVEWELEDNLTPSNAIVDNERNIIVTGLIKKLQSNNDMDAFIFKMAPNGEYIYDRLQANKDTSINYIALVQLSNGNYFVLGEKRPTNNPNNIQHQLIVAIYDGNLNLMFTSKYNYSDIYKCLGHGELIVENGTVLFVSSALRKQANPMNKYDLALFRFSQNGDTIETKFKHYQRNVHVNDLEKIPGSENYLIIEHLTQLYGAFECYILKPDLSMDTVNFFSSNDLWIQDGFTSDYWYPDKTFMLAGTLYMKNKEEQGLGAFRFDTLANVYDYILMDRTNIKDQIAYQQCMAFADEASIYVAGFVYDYWDCDAPDSIELYVIDTSLNQVAYKSLGGDISYDIYGVLAANNGDAIVYGKAWHPSGDDCYGNLVIYHVSREDLGLPPVKVLDLERTPGQAKVYPNPASNILNISVNKRTLKEHTRIKLFNSQGKKVYDYRLPHVGNTLQLDVTNLEPGLYVYNIASGKQVLVRGKFVKQ